MTKFQEKAINFLIDSDREKMKITFGISCNICSSKNLYGNCDNCPIAETYKLLLASFSDDERRKKECQT